jgi:signal peptidase I
VLGLKKLWREWRIVVVFAALMFVFRSAIADWYTVPTGSMKPTIVEGDRIFVNKLAYDIKIPFTLYPIMAWEDPRRGDVVVFDSPVDDQRLVKRVVGLPGDVITIQNNLLYINSRPATYRPADQAAAGKYWQVTEHPLLYMEAFGADEHLIAIKPREYSPFRDYGPVRVPPNHYFVLGDNRDNSADSRYIGMIDKELILGKANAVIFSSRRLDRFFVGL